MKSVKLHVEEKWCLLLIERWLKASIITKGGFLMERESGTPQGGVISPLLANLFMHYAFDKWITSKFPEVKWVRYADDGTPRTNVLAI
jgi:RNA-directed DNA polymerase